MRKEGAYMMEKKIPIGIESFEDIRKNGFFYVDKTGMIRELLNDWGKATSSPAPEDSENL